MITSVMNDETRKRLGVLGGVVLIASMVAANAYGGTAGAAIVALSQILTIAAIALIRPGHTYIIGDSAVPDETEQNASFSNWLNMRRGREQFSGEQTG
jgi:hypothetical protein